ncbi:MAG: ketopantoate reductase family protein [Acidobacteriota bacterium]
MVRRKPCPLSIRDGFLGHPSCSKMRTHKIAVVGIGPIGGILASNLIKNNEDVILVDIMKQKLERIKERGLKISDPNGLIRGSFEIKPENTLYSVSELDKFNVDVLFICVKAYAIESLIPEIKKIYNPELKLISFQNGLDTEKILGNAFGEEKIFRVVINYAGNLISDNEISVTFFNKPNYIGCLKKEDIPVAKELAEMISSAKLDTEYTNEIEKYVWEKVILNSALAPVSAITGLTMEEAMDLKETFEIVEQLVKEGIEVAKAHGNVFPPDFFDFCISYLRKGGYHKPSMLIDVEEGRRTEIDFINGKIVKYGELYSVEIPFQKSITFLVKGIEKRLKSAGN